MICLINHTLNPQKNVNPPLPKVHFKKRGKCFLLPVEPFINLDCFGATRLALRPQRRRRLSSIMGIDGPRNNDDV